MIASNHDGWCRAKHMLAALLFVVVPSLVFASMLGGNAAAQYLTGAGASAGPSRTVGEERLPGISGPGSAPLATDTPTPSVSQTPTTTSTRTPTPTARLV